MFEKRYRVLSLLAVLGEVRGRKKLQKIAFLLQHWGTDLQSRFTYHFYGPYSADLQALIQELAAQEFLTEEREKGQFVYRITEKGRDFIAKWEGRFAGEGRSPAQTARKTAPANIPVQRLKALAAQSAPFLELLSTYAYLLETGDRPDGAREKAMRLKPHLAGMLEDVIRFYEQVGQGMAKP
ncbi:MAG: hypothetical protein A6D91_06165 [Bacillaceae bacterium G1]|nr:MAG: hypothetical protein A6D91_06165 [Bacillaceae bacterium G1]